MTRRPAALITIRTCIVDQFVRGNWADLRARLIHGEALPRLTQTHSTDTAWTRCSAEVANPVGCLRS